VHRSSFLGALVLATVFAVLAPAVASAAPRHAMAQRGSAFAQLTSQPQGRVTINVRVTRFASTAAGPTARGIATATLQGLGGTPTTVRQRVNLAVSRAGRCNVLTLTLDQLDLTLLGLNVHLDKVVLKVTGRRHGGVLGSLFCSLANAKVKTASAAHAAAALNRAIASKYPIRPLRLTVPVQAVAAQAPTTVCKVLELILGPLHVDLLGLVVDLNRVHLTITATPGGGILGNLFCGLANTPVP
jgi:hypothetical protein